MLLDGSPDFVALAKAYGIPSMRVTDEASADEAIKKLSTEEGLMLVEVIVDKDFPTL